MTDKVQCLIHGETEATWVCRHIVDSLDTDQAVGFHWSQEDPSRRPDAWCWECEQVRLAEGDWTEAAREFVQVKTLCGGCYDRAKDIWLEARRREVAIRQ